MSMMKIKSIDIFLGNEIIKLLKEGTGNMGLLPGE